MLTKVKIYYNEQLKLTYQISKGIYFYIEVFNDEVFVENMFITFQVKHGSAYLDFQYYKED